MYSQGPIASLADVEVRLVGDQVKADDLRTEVIENEEQVKSATFAGNLTFEG